MYTAATLMYFSLSLSLLEYSLRYYTILTVARFELRHQCTTIFLHYFSSTLLSAACEYGTTCSISSSPVITLTCRDKVDAAPIDVAAILKASFPHPCYFVQSILTLPFNTDIF